MTSPCSQQIILSHGAVYDMMYVTPQYGVGLIAQNEPCDLSDADGAVGVDPFNIAQWGTSPPT